MKDKDNLLNKTFGYLTVIEYLGTRRYSGSMNRYWKCQCICGNTKEIPCQLLKMNKTKSCGCKLLFYRSVNARKEPGYAALTQLFSAYRSGAKRRKITFELTLEQFSKLTSENCHYCGVKPSHVINKISGNYKFNGIDRINNNLGYIIENCTACCETCNRAKLEMSNDEFLNWVRRVYEHNF